MSVLKVIDADGVDRYVNFTSGDGSINDPFSDSFVNDETNGVVNQNIDGITSPTIWCILRQWSWDLIWTHNNAINQSLK